MDNVRTVHLSIASTNSAEGVDVHHCGQLRQATELDVLGKWILCGWELLALTLASLCWINISAFGRDGLQPANKISCEELLSHLSPFDRCYWSALAPATLRNSNNPRSSGKFFRYF